MLVEILQLEVPPSPSFSTLSLPTLSVSTLSLSPSLQHCLPYLAISSSYLSF